MCPLSLAETPADTGGAGVWDAVVNAQNTLGGILGNAIDSAEAVFLGAQDTIGDLGETAGGVAGGAIEGAQGAAQTFAISSAVTAIGVGLVVGLVVDQVFSNGSVRSATLRAIGVGRR